MSQRQDYRGAAAALTLSADLSAGDLTFSVTGDTSGWPTGASGRPFALVIDRGKSSEEKLLCATLTPTAVYYRPHTTAGDPTDLFTFTAGGRQYVSWIHEADYCRAVEWLITHREFDGPVNLTIGKEGAGRLYFRTAARYAPANLKLAAADYGFKVERRYEAVDNPDDVRRAIERGERSGQQAR